MKAYAGEEAGVGLHDIRNALAEAWSALSVAKACLEKSFVTDADESLTKIDAVVGRNAESRRRIHRACNRTRRDV